MDLQPHHPPPTDRKPSIVDHSDFPALDDTPFGETSPHMSPMIKARRPSNSDPAAPFATSEGEWRSFAFPTADGSRPQQPPNPAQSSSTVRNPLFASYPATQPVHFPQSFWPMNTGSGSCTPTAGGANSMVEYGGNDGNAMALDRPAAEGQTYGNDGLYVDTGPSFFASSAFPGSPQSSKGGWVSASSSDGLDFRAAPPPARSQTPSFAGSTQLLRRDGIRKKNARFEIPAERNLRTIDQLINQTNDEQEIKELKQQKRLLRNRQAALDSRQRKKQHTERLEEEKKHYTAVITELEEHLSDIKLQEGEWMRAKDAWASSQQQYQACIDSMMMEKEEMVRRHTIETGELRQKNALLMEQLQRFDGATMSSGPGAPHGFATDFPDFGELPGPWDDFPTTAPAPRFTLESEPAPAPPAIPAQSPAGRPADGSAAPTDSGDEDKSVASGLLLMLLLCGAWVASRGGNGNPSSPPPPLPAIPDSVRTASAHLLDDLYRDSGVALDAPSSTADPVTSGGNPGAHFGTPQSQQLDTLHRRLIAPSPQQIREQAFALTPGQYNRIAGVGEDDAAMLSPPPTAPLENPRRMAKSLADAVSAAAAQTVASGGERAAEGYTRSLMRDKVSTQVLEDFARMVAGDKYRNSMS